MRYSAFAALLLATPISAQTPLDPASALKQIVDAVCVPVPLEGSSQNISVKADAKAGLSGLLQGFADAGLEGAADFKSAEYVGFLQAELSGQADAQRKCNMMVFQTFAPKIEEWISESSAGHGSVTGNTIHSSGNDNTNIQGSGNTVSNK